MRQLTFELTRPPKAVRVERIGYAPYSDFLLSLYFIGTAS